MRTLETVRHESRTHFFKAFDGEGDVAAHAQTGLTHALARLNLTHIGTTSIHRALEPFDETLAARIGMEVANNLRQRQTPLTLEQRVKQIIRTDANTAERRAHLSNEFKRARTAQTTKLVTRFEHLRHAAILSVAHAAREFYQPGRHDAREFKPSDAQLKTIAIDAYRHAVPILPVERPYGHAEDNPLAVAIQRATHGAMEAVADKARLPAHVRVIMHTLNVERARLTADRKRHADARYQSPEVTETLDARFEDATHQAALSLSEHFHRLKDVQTYFSVETKAVLATNLHLRDEFGLGDDGQPT